MYIKIISCNGYESFFCVCFREKCFFRMTTFCFRKTFFTSKISPWLLSLIGFRILCVYTFLFLVLDWKRKRSATRQATLSETTKKSQKTEQRTSTRPSRTPTRTTRTPTAFSSIETLRTSLALTKRRRKTAVSRSRETSWTKRRKHWKSRKTIWNLGESQEIIIASD